MLLSTGIILSAFAGITYVLVNKLEPDSAHAKVSHPGERTSHLGERTSHLGERTSHLGERTSHLGERTSHLGERTSHLGERTSHLGERKSHLGERTPTERSHGERASHSGGHQPRKGDSAWSYEGEHGPAHWGQFAPLALSGIRQSPIDLVVDRALNPAIWRR